MKKNLLLGFLTILVAGFGFGGISMAEGETDISTATISSVSSKYAYTQSTITPEPVVKIKINGATTTLASGTDYNIEYSNNTNIGTAKIIITGIGNYTGSTEKSFTITNSISDMSVSGPSQTTFVVTGQPITPEITKVYLGDTILTQGTDYNVGYSDNTSIGTAKITITGIGNYTGHKEKTFTIISNDDVKYTINGQPKASNFTSSTITSNGTYKLYTDTTLTARLVPGILASNIILDLNGHTLTSTASDYGILLSRAGTATSHKTFSIIDSSENKGGKIVVNSAAKAAIQGQGNYNDITIGEGVTIEGGAITTLKENITLTVNGTINGGDDFAIATNGDSSKNITININEGAVLTSNVTAVYLPGKEGLVANIDGTIESKTVGIEIRAGELTIGEHANIKSTYEGTTSSTANGNGTTTVGSALAIAQHTTKLPIVVTINGGTFEGISAIYQSNPQNNSQEDAEKVSTTINTGTIIGKVTNTDSNHKLNINGGIFSTNPTEYISAGYKVFTTSDGKYEVANGYTITFNPNNEKDSYTKDVKANTTFSEPETPVYTGNIFLGWYNGDNKFDFSTAINSALTLEGKWEAISESTGTREQDDGTSTGVILEPEEATISSSVQNSLNTSTTTTTVEGAVELNVYGDIDGDGTIDEGTDNIITKKVNFKKAVPIRIPVNGKNSVKIKVRHNGTSTFDISGLTTTAGNCTGGVAKNNIYNGTSIAVKSGYAEIYTCSASLFVAYTESAKVVSSGGGSGGGSVRSTSSNNTGSTATTGDTANSSTEESNTQSNEDIVFEGEVTAPSVVISDSAKNTYDAEQLEAYVWAYNHGITTINDADKARLSDPLTRAELAKMMVQYIKNVLNKDPVKIDTVKYADVDASLGDLADYITLVYQYQIMGINADGTAIENFNPNGLVTRAEYATVFSRVLFGDKYNQTGEDFYSKHLAALKEAGILSNDTPTIQEVRGWVMLMMYRSAKENKAAEENTPAEEKTAEIANPASVYCEEQGGELSIVKDKEGNESGMCKLADGTEIEEWEYYRANHKEATDTTGSTAEESSSSN